MTKTKKIILGTLIGAFTLGGVATYADYKKNGGFKGRFMHHMVERVSDKLDLNDVQKTKLDAIKAQLQAKREARNPNNHPMKQLAALMADSNFDQGKAMDMVKQRSAEMETHAAEMISAIADFSNSLSPEQRNQAQTMLNKMAERKGRGRHGKAGHGGEKHGQE